MERIPISVLLNILYCYSMSKGFYQLQNNPQQLYLSIRSLDVWEAVSADDRLSGDSTNGAHGKAPVQKFGLLLSLHCGRVSWSKDCLSKV